MGNAGSLPGTCLQQRLDSEVGKGVVRVIDVVGPSSGRRNFGPCESGQRPAGYLRLRATRTVENPDFTVEIASNG